MFNIIEIGKSGLKISDGNYSSKYPTKEEFVKEGVPFIRANNFYKNGIKDDELYFISEEKHAVITKGHLKPNDVLITTRGNIGALALVPNRHNNSNINAQIVLLRSNENWFPKFLLYALSSKFVQNQLNEFTTGTALKQLSVRNLRKIKVPFPQLETQKRIAEILDDATALRDKTEKLLTEYDALAQAIFLDMFGDPVINPKGWELKMLKNLTTKIGSGATPRGGKNAYKKEGISLIRSLNIYDNEFKYKDLAFIDENQADRLNNVIVEKNDVLINITGASVARCTIVPNEVLPARVNQHVSILRPKGEILDSIYLLHLIISPSSKIKFIGVGTSGGATREAITKSQLEEFEIPVPPIELQNEFSDKIALIEKQKALAKKELQESEDLFNALLQKAFKGELVT